MVHWKRWLAATVMSITALAGIAIALSFFFSHFLVDIWWFDSVGYEAYFWQRALYRYAVLGSVSIFFFLIFFLNFWVASRFLGATLPAKTPTAASLKSYRRLLQGFRTGSMWVYTPLSIILSVVIALPLYERWEAFLLYLFSPRAKVADPVYGNEIGYYLFAYPIYTLIQHRLLIAFGVLLAAITLLYLVERRILAREEKRLPAGAKAHISILVFLVFLIEIWDFVLQRYGLLYSRSHLPLFFGPGYVEMNITWVLIWICMILLTGAAISLIYFINTRKGIRIFAGFAVVFALGFGARYSDSVLQTVEKYIVKPNESSTERPYIQNTIKSTLAAYRLDDVEVRDFNPERIPTDISIPDIQSILRNTPVWDGELLDDVYKQLQNLRTYYDFPGVDVDRYTVNGLYQQVFLSARELNRDQIPEGARNWINEHLSYTHGFGAVMTPAGQAGDEPMVWFLRGIPPESAYGFKIEQPGIYFGQIANDYVIAPNGSGEIDYPKGSSNVLTSYSGKGGVPLHSLLKRFVFSVYFKDRNIFFTSKLLPESRIIFRHKLTERIRTLTPYLILDRDPYLVVTQQKLFWIQDAYTVSDKYPMSMPLATQTGEVSYIRNSVKITMDAYDGSIDFYLFDPQDPIIGAYSRIYPGIFKDASQMPDELKPHVRYPKEIFETQMAIYAKYHQTDPEVFYQQEDIWEFAKTYKGKQSSEISPYYLTLDLIEPGRFDFLLLLPMSPSGRDNLRSLTLVGCDRPYYGKIIVYNFPKGELVFGPSQIYALINQDTTISQQFTLWDQAGSEVDRGKMIILPVRKVMLYIQPVYLKSATRLKIPELKRLIVSQGQIVIMETSLEEAYAQLQKRIKSEAERMDKRFAPLMQQPPQ
ncbi:MAG TPA: UPF0182 family protein [Deltaproteobacteria bacterium]|jgi:uncharacterized membrane protein (UPF0182 family)|nr:UPF0182 family protein [Deltaproteobacteria bacterium]